MPNGDSNQARGYSGETPAKGYGTYSSADYPAEANPDSLRLYSNWYETFWSAVAKNYWGSYAKYTTVAEGNCYYS